MSNQRPINEYLQVIINSLWTRTILSHRKKTGYIQVADPQFEDRRRDKPITKRADLDCRGVSVRVIEPQYAPSLSKQKMKHTCLMFCGTSGISTLVVNQR